MRIRRTDAGLVCAEAGCSIFWVVIRFSMLIRFATCTRSCWRVGNGTLICINAVEVL